MDPEAWNLVRLTLEGLGGLVMAALGYVVNGLRQNDDKLARAIDGLGDKIVQVELKMSERYVQKADFVEALREVKTSIERLQDVIVTHFQKE